MIKPVKLSDTLVVSAQPALEDFAPLAAQGFKVVVCNRPDGETADQPLTADVRQAVEAAGQEEDAHGVAQWSMALRAGHGATLCSTEGSLLAARRTWRLSLACLFEGLLSSLPAGSRPGGRVTLVPA